MSKKVTRRFKTHRHGAVTVHMVRPGKWELRLGAETFTFEHVKTFGPAGEFWTVPDGSTSDTLEFAVVRTLTKHKMASAMVAAFRVFSATN